MVGGRLLPHFKPDRDCLVNRTAALPSVRKFLTIKPHWTLMSIYYAIKRQCFWKTGPLPRASHWMLSRRDPQAQLLVEVLCGLSAQDSPPRPRSGSHTKRPSCGGRALNTHTFSHTAPPRPPVLIPVTDTKHHNRHHGPSHVQTHIWRFCREGRGPVAGSPGLW